MMIDDTDPLVAEVKRQAMCRGSYENGKEDAKRDLLKLLTAELKEKFKEPEGQYYIGFNDGVSACISKLKEVLK